MPQDSIFPDEPRYVGYRITWDQVDLVTGPEWNCTIRRKEHGEGWQTVHVSRWRGVMMDLASTMSEDCLNAYLYDEPRGLAKAAVTVHRCARAHLRRYERVG